MAEYINKNALLADIDETVIFTVRGGAKLPTAEMRGANKVIDRIKSAPTADVVEAQRGKVIVLDHDEWWGCVYECCTCKGQWMIEPRKPAICCPYCGVRLGGKGENK